MTIVIEFKLKVVVQTGQISKIEPVYNFPCFLCDISKVCVWVVWTDKWVPHKLCLEAVSSYIAPCITIMNIDLETLYTAIIDIPVIIMVLWHSYYALGSNFNRLYCCIKQKNSTRHTINYNNIYFTIEYD